MRKRLWLWSFAWVGFFIHFAIRLLHTIKTIQNQSYFFVFSTFVASILFFRNWSFNIHCALKKKFGKKKLFSMKQTLSQNLEAQQQMYVSFSKLINHINLLLSQILEHIYIRNELAESAFGFSLVFRKKKKDTLSLWNKQFESTITEGSLITPNTLGCMFLSVMMY